MCHNSIWTRVSADFDEHLWTNSYRFTRMLTALLSDFEYFGAARKQKTQQNQRFAGLRHLLVCLFVTPSGFKPETF